MRFQCIVTYRSARSKSISTWRTRVQGADIVSAADAVIKYLKRRERHPLTVVGIYVQLQAPEPD